MDLIRNDFCRSEALGQISTAHHSQEYHDAYARGVYSREDYVSQAYQPENNWLSESSDSSRGFIAGRGARSGSSY